MLVGGEIVPDEVAGAQIGPEVLGLAEPVVLDQGVGSGEDVLGRPVVAVERDHPCLREGLLEAHQVAVVRAAEGVDGLVHVADDADVAVGRLEQADELELRGVGVLELVDEEVAPPLPVDLVDLGVPQHLHRADDEVVEVHGVGLLEEALVLPEDRRHRPELPVGARLHDLWAEHFVLDPGDGVEHLGGLEP